MRTLHLSRLRLRGVDLQELGLLHAQWAVGLGDFAALRLKRLAAGMPADVTAEDIAGDLMKVSLPEPGGTTVTSVIRMSSRSGVALVEHLVVRQGGAYRLTPSSEVPEVVMQLLTDARLVPGEIAGFSPERVAEDGASRLVARLLSSEWAYPTPAAGWVESHAWSSAALRRVGIVLIVLIVLVVPIVGDGFAGLGKRLAHRSRDDLK